MPLGAVRHKTGWWLKAENPDNFGNIVLPTPAGVKKVVSILLLAVFLFKMGGYDVCFWLLKKQSVSEERKKIWAALDKETVQHRRVPMPLPYMQPRSFDMAGSLIESRGEFLRIIELNWENDTLHFSFVKDHDLKLLADTMSEYEALGDDQRGSSALKLPPGFLKEYHACKTAYPETKLGWMMELGECTFETFILSLETIVETPPPEVA